jgi:hypothetical protein
LLYDYFKYTANFRNVRPIAPHIASYGPGDIIAMQCELLT